MIRPVSRIKPGLVHIRAFAVSSSANIPVSSPGIAVRRTASLPLAYDRATQYSRDVDDRTREAAAYWVPRSSRGTTMKPLDPLRLLLHILDAGEDDALGALPGVAEIEFILGEEHRIAVDVVGNAGAVGGNESIQFLAVVG